MAPSEGAQVGYSGRSTMQPPLWFRDRACEQRAAGDLDGALATLDDGLATVGLDGGAEDELALLLHTKAVTLGLAARYDEAEALFHRVLELIEGREDEAELRLLQALCWLGMALLLSERGNHANAKEALLDVELLYVADDDPDIRAVATSALGFRIGELLRLGELDEALEHWEVLRVSHGADPDPAVRADVAVAGRTTALALLEARRTSLALATARRVIALYRAETDPDIRAAVAVAMLARLVALWRRARLLAVWRETRALVLFLGSNPEPQVVEAMRSAGPYGAALVRRALGGKKES